MRPDGNSRKKPAWNWRNSNNCTRSATPAETRRGWTISIAYLARIDFDAVKPKAADDAAEVGWFSLNELPALAFDHAEILRCVVATLTEETAKSRKGRKKG